MLHDRQLELLSPAKTAEIGREAILHGADAVYIGGPSFGARHNASNPIEDIAALVEFAHRYHARIFVTMNTIMHDAELELARKQIWQLYEAGVDALIVQDMGLLEMDLPPIQLHASTQCDIRTVDKARFLGDVGFSQLVLARELSLEQIRAIRAATDTPLEYFVHGALCVAFSGQCYISHADTGRSNPSRPVLVRTAMDGSTVCLKTAESAGCATYQAALLRTVGQKAAASRTNISVNDLGRRQLSALIASIN